MLFVTAQLPEEFLISISFVSVYLNELNLKYI